MFEGFEKKSFWTGVAVGVAAIAILSFFVRLFLGPVFYHGYGYEIPMMWNDDIHQTHFQRR